MSIWCVGSPREPSGGTGLDATEFAFSFYCAFDVMAIVFRERRCMLREMRWERSFAVSSNVVFNARDMSFWTNVRLGA